LEKKKLTEKNILIYFIIIISIFLYFFLMYQTLKPNILTWWSDEYEYVSQARNFALFSKLETSFYSARAVLYGNFPSFGYHPILYSFLMGLFLKIFNAVPKTTFAFNYMLTFLTLLIVYFYSKERIEKKETIYPPILVATFPVFIIYTNTQSPEIFFICIVSLVYYIFFKNSFKFNISHFTLLVLLAMVSCQRYTYFILSGAILIFIYYRWLKDKKIIYFLSSIIFFTGFYYLLYRLFVSKLQFYPTAFGESTYFHIKYYGISSLASKETWALFYHYIIQNIIKFIHIFINPASDYFIFHWLFFGIIFINIFLLFKTKERTLKKELSLILIPEFILIIACITSYPPGDLEHFSHLRPLFGFLPLNLFYLIIFIKKLKLKIKIVFLSVFISLLLISSFYAYKPFYTKKIENSSHSYAQNIKIMSDTIEKYRYKDHLTIAGIDDIEAPLRDCVVFGNNGDKFIRTNQFPLTEEEINPFMEKVNIDMWLIKNDNCSIKNRLNKWPFSYDIKNDDIFWKLFIKEDAYPMELFYETDIDKFTDEWRPLNQCRLIIVKNQIVVNASGEDSYFENMHIFDFNENLNYYLKITLISPEDSYLQIYYRKDDPAYREQNSSKLLTVKGENTFITKISENMIRIDPGTVEGIYIIKDIRIYSSEY